MCKEVTVANKSARMREISHKTPKILIEINLDRDCRTKDKREIYGVLAASNVVMAAPNNVLAAYDYVLAASDEKNQCTIYKCM